MIGRRTGAIANPPESGAEDAASLAHSRGMLHDGGCVGLGGLDVPADAMHLNAHEAGTIARAAGAKRLLLVHGESGTDREGSVEVARAAFGGPVEWARERHVYAA